MGKYPYFKNVIVSCCAIDSGVRAQPIGLDETITGAKNRARRAFESQSADIGVGIESGIIPVPHTKTGYMDTTACALFDGAHYHIGLSSCFEYPPELIKKVLNEGKEITDGALELGFTEDPAFRQGIGMIGILTQGVISRIDYSEQAVHTALIHLLNAEHYRS